MSYILIEYTNYFVLSENAFITNGNKDQKFYKSNGFKNKNDVVNYIKKYFKIDINNIKYINGIYKNLNII